MLYEIRRAIRLIDKGVFFYTWDNKTRENPICDPLETFDSFHISNLLKTLQEASFIYPEMTELNNAYRVCLEKMSNHQVKDFGEIATEQENIVSPPAAMQ